MVKIVTASAFVPSLSPQGAFQRLYASPEATQRYHAECNRDPDARVGPWEDGRREVVFAVPAPALLAKTVGVKTMTVREVSTREDADGSGIIIRSDPVMDFAGGSRFTTSSVLRMEARDGGCQISAEVSCKAAGPWGMVGMIEDTMATQAQDSIDSFLAFAVSWCEAAPAASQEPAEVPAEASPPQPQQSSIVSPAQSADEAFYDATALSDASGLSRAGSVNTAEMQQLSSRVRALEAAVRKLEAAQRQQLPVPRFWAVSAASFAVAAAVLGSVALAALEYGRRSRPPAAAGVSLAPAVRPL